MTMPAAFPGDDFPGVRAVQVGDRTEAVRLWARAAGDRYLAAERLLQIATPWGTRLRAEDDARLNLGALVEAHDVIAARFRRDIYQPNRDLFASGPTPAEEIADQWWAFLHREVAELVADTTVARLVIAAIAENDGPARHQAGTTLAAALREHYRLPAPA